MPVRRTALCTTRHLALGSIHALWPSQSTLHSIYHGHSKETASDNHYPCPCRAPPSLSKGLYNLLSTPDTDLRGPVLQDPDPACESLLPNNPATNPNTPRPPPPPSPTLASHSPLLPRPPPPYLVAVLMPVLVLSPTPPSALPPPSPPPPRARPPPTKPPLPSRVVVRASARRAPAHPSSAPVPSMNTHTTTRSRRLSRWKQLVVTSFSSASRQIGRLYCRQKARLHCAHDDDAARGSGGARLRAVFGEVDLVVFESESESDVVVVVAAAAAAAAEEEEEGEDGGAGAGAGWSFCGPRGMMVLFWKQVHLQKVGTAGWRC